MTPETHEPSYGLLCDLRAPIPGLNRYDPNPILGWMVADVRALREISLFKLIRISKCLERALPTGLSRLEALFIDWLVCNFFVFDPALFDYVRLDRMLAGFRRCSELVVMEVNNRRRLYEYRRQQLIHFPRAEPADLPDGESDDSGVRVVPS